MQRGYRRLAVLVLAAVIVVVNGLAVAQSSSKHAYVNLIAVLPESLGVAVNPQSVGGLSLAVGGAAPGNIAGSVTISWALLPGRAEVAAWALVSGASGVLLAVAVDSGGNPFADAWPSSLPDRIPLTKPSLPLKLAATNLTQLGRTGAHTLDLPLAIQQIPAPVLPQDPAGSVVRIQVQAVP